MCLEFAAQRDGSCEFYGLQLDGNMTEAEAKITNYLRASAGTCNYPSDHTLRCFLGMIETGEVTVDDCQRIGGDFLVAEIKRIADQYKPPIKLEPMKKSQC